MSYGFAIFGVTGPTLPFFRDDSLPRVPSETAVLEEKVRSYCVDVQSTVISYIVEKVLEIRDALAIPSSSMEKTLEQVKKIVTPFVVPIFAWVVGKGLQREPIPPFARRGLGMLLALDKFESKWLPELCQLELAPDIVLRQIDTLRSDCGSDQMLSRSRKISHYYKQLIKSSLHSHQKLACAIYSAMKFDPESKAGSDVIAKEKVGLPYSLHRDFANRAIYVITHTKKTSIKVVKQGLRLSYDPGGVVCHVAEARNKEDADVEEVRRELELQRSMYQINPIGICPIWSSAYSSETSISFIMPWGVTLDELITNQYQFPLNELVSIIRQLACAINTIHSAGYVHGDIKTTNIVCRMSGDVMSLAEFIDFGMCCKVESKEKFYTGFYGSMSCSPPEFVGQDQEVDLKAVEMFAFGFTLYVLLFRALPPWVHITHAYRDAYSEKPGRYLMGEGHLKIMQQNIQESIEVPRRALVEKQGRTHLDTLHLFVYDCMRLEPALRLTAQQAIEQFN